MSTDLVAIGSKLRALRGGRKAADVAKELNIAVRTLYAYEGGERMPSDDVKKRIAVYFDTDLAGLFFGDDSFY